MNDFYMWIIGQTVVLGVIIIGAAMRGERRITRIEGNLKHVEKICAQVPGISRAVARLEGRNDRPAI